MSISWDLTPHGGGDHVLFQHFSSPQGRHSCPFSTLLLPEGEAVMSFFNTSPPRRGGTHVFFYHFSSPRLPANTGWSIWW